jgi:hypothetical protein
LLFPDEPAYNGKRMGEWLVTCVGGGGDVTPAAKDTFHQVGTNAIPALLKRLAYRNFNRGEKRVLVLSNEECWVGLHGSDTESASALRRVFAQFPAVAAEIHGH